MMVYNGHFEVFEGIEFVPGKEYGIVELGTGTSYRRYPGIAGMIGAMFGVRERLDDTYNVQVHCDRKSATLSYATYDAFRSIWKFRDEKGNKFPQPSRRADGWRR